MNCMADTMSWRAHLEVCQGPPLTVLNQELPRSIVPVKAFNTLMCSCCNCLPSQTLILKKCSQCQLARYCSKECQKKHWAEHKQFCRFLKSYHPNENEVPYQTILDLFEFTTSEQLSTVMEMIHLKVSNKLKRNCTNGELQLLSLLQFCEICFAKDPDELVRCSACHTVSFCGQHLAAGQVEHEEVQCLALQLRFHLAQVLTKLGAPDLPFCVNVNTTYSKLSGGLLDYVDSFYPENCPENVFFKSTILGENVLYPSRLFYKTNTPKFFPGDRDLTILSFLTEFLSYPMSLMYGIQRTCVGKHNHSVEKVSRLNVHVVGAKLGHEMGMFRVWECIFHQLPLLTNLTLTFIGPEVHKIPFFDDEFEFVDGSHLLCSDCRGKKKKIRCEISDLLYHEFVSSEYHSSPDLIIVFNGGFSVKGINYDWIKTFGYMGRECQQVPLIFTSFSVKDAEKDVQTIERHLGLNVVLPSQKNPFGSQMLHFGDCGAANNNWITNGYICAARIERKK